jgi:hypothetical protein
LISFNAQIYYLRPKAVWMHYNRLQLNTVKTRACVVRHRPSASSIITVVIAMRVGPDFVQRSSFVRDFGIYVDTDVPAVALRTHCLPNASLFFGSSGASDKSVYSNRLPDDGDISGPA